MRFLTPAEIVDLAEAIHARYRALVFVGAYSGLRMGELAGLRQSRVDLLAEAITVAETLTEVKGKLIAGPPKTRASRRTVGLPPFVVRELEEHLAAAQRPGSHIFTAPGGKGAAGPGLSGALLGAGYQGSRPAGPAHPRPSPHRRGAVDRRRRDAQGGHRARGTPRSASPWTAMATRRSPGWSRRVGAIQ
jgi:integrase